VRMSTQTMTVTVVMTMIMIVRMVVTVAMAVVRMAAGFLGFVVHPLDSNRDLVCLTAWIRSSSVVNNRVDSHNRRERTRWPKRN
jgi:hypothetical protein